MLLILNESVYKDIEGKDPEILQVVPIAYHDYERLMKKPYKYPPKNQVWRLMFDSYVEQGRNGADEYGHTFFTRVELIGSTLDDTYTYSYRYVKRPRPIVLEDLA